MAAGVIHGVSETLIAPEEIRLELETVVASPTFERSERLRRFLRYVCERTLQGEGARINEYLIGAEVFDRGPDYSPNEDSVVRRQAHALRQKLQEYYAADGSGSAIRIELPVGRYVPTFRRATVAHVAGADRTASQLTRGRMTALGVSLAVLAFLAGGIVGRRTSSLPAAKAGSQALPAAVSEVWAPWLQDPAGAVICFSNPLTTVVKQFQQELPQDSLPRRMRVTREMEKELRRVLRLEPGGYLYLTPSTAQAKMGEAVSAAHLAGWFSRAGAPVRTTQSRFLSWQDFRRENLVLLGHNEANKWLDPLLEKHPFRLATTEGSNPRRILNTRPTAGEQPSYYIEFSHDQNEATQEYALVSMIPGVDGQHRLLLISGLNTQATQMAAEYLTNPAMLEELLRRLRAGAPKHAGAWYFQAVLRAEVRDKVPIGVALVAVRVL